MIVMKASCVKTVILLFGRTGVNVTVNISLLSSSTLSSMMVILVTTNVDCLGNVITISNGMMKLGLELAKGDIQTHINKAKFKHSCLNLC